MQLESLFGGKKKLKPGADQEGDLAEKKDEVIKDGIVKEKTPKLEIASFTENEYRSGIPIPNDDFHKLAQALEIYAGGVGRASNATRDDYQRNQWASFHIAMHGLSNPQYADVKPDSKPFEGPFSTNRFINDIVTAARDAYQANRDGWSKHFDYDGQGRFHKTTVEVDFDRDNHTLILELNAAYVGKEVEEELAASLGVERAINHMSLSLRLPDMADQDLTVPFSERQTFRLDCEPIAQAINHVVKNFGIKSKPISGTEVADLLMRKSEYNEDKGVIKVIIGIVTLRIGISGAQRFAWLTEEYGWENLKDTRIQDGSAILLPFPADHMNIDQPLLDYSQPRKPIRHYGVYFDVRRTSSSDYSGLAMHTFSRREMDAARMVIEDVKEAFGLQAAEE